MPCFVTSTDLRLVNKVHFSAALVAYKHSSFRVHLNSLRWAFQSHCIQSTSSTQVQQRAGAKQSRRQPAVTPFSSHLNLVAAHDTLGATKPHQLLTPLNPDLRAAMTT